MPVVPLSSVPLSRDGYYATNNQFQLTGPKGFTEFKLLENDDLYFRLDLPGVPEEKVSHMVMMEKQVLIAAEAPKEHKHDSGARRYLAATGLVCDCCEISNVQASTTDGVLRMLLSKKKIEGKEKDPSQPRRGCPVHAHGNGYVSDGTVWAGRVLQDHPWVVEGSNRAFESKQLQNGGLYVRIDLPGVPKENFKIVVEDGTVMFVGRGRASVGYDSNSRTYAGKVALLNSSRPGRKIKFVIKNGVARLTIPPS